MDVLCVGSATVDLFLVIDPQNPHFRFSETTNEMSVHLGDKIVFENAQFEIGGNACNVSVGLKKLGVNSSLMAEVGDDEFSQKITSGLQEAGVDTSLLKKKEGQSCFSVILNYQGDRVIFTENTQKEHDFSFDNISSKWIYLTSLGGNWENIYQKVSDFVKNTGAKLVLNPGASQIDKGPSSFSYILPQTEVLIVNKEEAEEIVGSQSDVQNLLTELKKLGPKIVVITDGENGSYVLSENGENLSHESSKSPSLSKTGAGDAYSSGFLAALVLGKNLQDAMDWGTKNAGSVVGKIGAQRGLLTREEIEK